MWKTFLSLLGLYWKETQMSLFSPAVASFPYEEESRPRAPSSKAAIPPPVYDEPERPRSPTGPSNSFLANMG